MEPIKTIVSALVAGAVAATKDVGGKMIKDDYGKIYKPFKLINKSIIEATPEEIKENRRARSAKLRVAERLEDNIDWKEFS